jgi:uncharacterized RDD family membrane protein YckC
MGNARIVRFGTSLSDWHILTDSLVESLPTPDFVRREIRSAKRTVIKTCQHCGAVNGEPADTCCFCDSRLGATVKSSPSSHASPAQTQGNLALEPAWKREVASRVRAYRARRLGVVTASTQPALPFDFEPFSQVRESDPCPVSALPFTHTLRASQGALQTERFEIAIPNRDLDFSDPGLRTGDSRHARAGHAFGTAMEPVAPLLLRCRAGTIDSLFLLIGFGGVLALFWGLGGRITFAKADVLVLAAVLGLFYAQYFALFTIFGGTTPGMMILGLRVASLDGGVPTSQHMVWRGFGYLVSAGTCLLGFLWALWDGDHLCWHDRMSRSYITSVQSVTSSSGPGDPPDRVGPDA